jgi:hypothetical protein
MMKPLGLRSATTRSNKGRHVEPRDEVEPFFVLEGRYVGHSNSAGLLRSAVLAPAWATISAETSMPTTSASG